MDYWTNAVRPYDRPDEERNASSWNDICLDRKQMPDLVNWKPQEWQRADPEQEERDEISRVRSR